MRKHAAANIDEQNVHDRYNEGKFHNHRDVRREIRVSRLKYREIQEFHVYGRQRGHNCHRGKSVRAFDESGLGLMVPSPIIPPPPRGDGPQEVVALMMKAAMAMANWDQSRKPNFADQKDTTPAPVRLLESAARKGQNRLELDEYCQHPPTPKNGTFTRLLRMTPRASNPPLQREPLLQESLLPSQLREAI